MDLELGEEIFLTIYAANIPFKSKNINYQLWTHMYW
jgi:hypothetical protein